jgi:hypothetical protein
VNSAATAELDSKDRPLHVGSGAAPNASTEDTSMAAEAKMALVFILDALEKRQVTE